MGDRVAVMKQGRLQQVDAPQVLYDHPANLFVGGLHRLAGDEHGRGELRRDGRRPCASPSAAITLALDRRVVADATGPAAFEGGRVVVGIRPEDIEDAAIDGDAPADRRFRATGGAARGARLRGPRALRRRRAARAHRGHARARPRRRARPELEAAGTRDARRSSRG